MTGNVVDELKSEFPVILRQDVIWGDMDAFGHVNNTVYFRYFEDARLAYFDLVGINAFKGKTQLGPILATTHCDFRLPLEYPDRIHIAGRSTILGPKKCNMHYAVYSERFNAVAAQGEGLLVYYDYNASRSCPIPESIVAAINELETGIDQGQMD